MDFKKFKCTDFSFLIFIAALAAFSSTANASFEAVSPAAANGFPQWYMDENGLALDLCLDQNGLCALPPEFDPAITNPPLPIGAMGPGTFPDEFSYWTIESTIYNLGINQRGKAKLTLALEGRFSTLEGIPEAGKQKTVLFINFQTTNVTLAHDAVYTVTHPFGSFTFTTDEAGNPSTGEKGQTFRVEDGCVSATCNFAQLLPAFNTGIGPFIGWNTGFFTDSTGKKYLGDGATPHAITAGPNGAIFRISGPNTDGSGGSSMQTPLWIVSGKVSDASITHPANETKVSLSDNHTGAFVKNNDRILITATFSGPAVIAEGSDAPKITIGVNVNAAAMTKSSNLVWTYVWNVQESERPVSVIITAKDTGGNPVSRETGKKNYFVDNTPPPAPSVDSPLHAIIINAAEFRIKGTAEANALVQVIKDGTVAGDMQLTGGATEFNIPVYLTQDSDNEYNITATDAAGNVGSLAPVPVIVETNTDLTVAMAYSPGRPVKDADSLIITANFAGANSVDETEPPKISIDYAGAGNDISNATMSKTSNSVWRYTANIPAGNDGPARIAIAAKDQAGNPNRPAVYDLFVVDNTPPAAPTVVSPFSALSINAIAFDVRGSAEEASLVKIYSGPQLVGSQQLRQDSVTYGILIPLVQNAVNNFAVSATDAAGNEGPKATVPAITEDSISPNITGVQAGSVTSDSATIIWTTDESSSSFVFYGTTANTTLAASGADQVISHSVTLSGLSPSTQYFYNAGSCDAARNCANSTQFSFTTLAAPPAPSGGEGGGGGGGGYGTSGYNFCTPNWSCTIFSPCIDGLRTRNCTDTNKCNTTYGRPDINRTCTAPIPTNITNITNYTGNVTPPITGNITPPGEQQPSTPTGLLLGITTGNWLAVLLAWTIAAILSYEYKKRWMAKNRGKGDELQGTGVEG